MSSSANSNVCVIFQLVLIDWFFSPNCRYPTSQSPVPFQKRQKGNWSHRAEYLLRILCFLFKDLEHSQKRGDLAIVSHSLPSNVLCALRVDNCWDIKSNEWPVSQGTLQLCFPNVTGPTSSREGWGWRKEARTHSSMLHFLSPHSFQNVWTLHFKMNP